MTFSFIQMPGLTSQKEAQNKINESGPIEPMTHTMVDPSQITRGPAKKKKMVVKKPLHATNKNKKITGSKTEDEPTQDNGETAKMNPKISANEDVRVIHRIRGIRKKPKKFKNVMPHLSGVNPPKPLQPQLNSKDWDLDEISSLDETSFDDFINNLTEEEFENLKESYTSWRADRAEKKFKSKKQHEKDKARLNKYTAALDRMNNKNLKIAIKGAQPGHTTGGQKVNADTEYQGGKTMNEMSKIRKALLDVVEKKSHGHTDAREKWKDKFKGAGAEQMKKDLEDNPKDNPIWNKEKESHDDAEKAGRAGPGKSPARGGADNLKGETKIIPPGTKMKDPGAPKTKIDPNVDKGKPSTNEQREGETFMKSKDNLSNIIDAYNSMNNDQ